MGLSEVKRIIMILQNLEAQGLPVDIHFYRPNSPAITFGNFQLNNNGANAIELSITHVACRVGDVQTAVDDYFLYVLPDYEEQDVDKITLASCSENVFEISFAAIDLSELPFGDVVVAVRLCVDDVEFDVMSPVTITIRTRRRD